MFHSFFIMSRRECLFKICLTKLLSIICLFLKTSPILVNFFLTHPVLWPWHCDHNNKIIFWNVIYKVGFQDILYTYVCHPSIGRQPVSSRVFSRGLCLVADSRCNNLLRSAWRSCHQVFLGRRLLHFPWGFQDKLCLVMLVVAFLRVWTIHSHLLPISSPKWCMVRTSFNYLLTFF